MDKKRFSVRAILITVLITFLLTGGLGILAARCLLGPGGLALLEGKGLIERRFIAEYDQDAAVDGALAGMVDALGDRWSHYLTAEQRKQLDRARENAYVGIGIRYQKSEKPFGMEIVDVTAEGPAEEAGLTVGEFIVGIDGESLTEDNFESLVAQIGDREGQAVAFTVENAQGERREVSITARKVEDPPVEYALLDGDVGYVRIENFYQNCAASGQKAVDDLVAQGAKGLLFDLRSNPGGYVHEMTEFLDYLLPEGPIFAEHSKNSPVQTVESDAQCVDLPMVVLVDENSYSAAELFSAQLRESVGAKLVGQQTCGKGYYQQGFPLSNGGQMNISTGMYTTGAGVSLIGTGLTPDYVVEGQQEQADKAVEVILEEIEKR